MHTTTATVSVKGQITIPKRIRDAMTIRTGDKVHFIMEERAVRFLPAKKKLTSLKGVVAKPKKPVSIDDMRAAVKQKGGNY